ncbi:MAG TPA: ABC transporter permease, partial [Sporichthyaceae bacterium]|jgi:ABC-2 type transport system permease protein
LVVTRTETWSRTRTLIQRRRILYLLVSRDLKVKYSDSTLGYVWTVLEPLTMAMVYWFVFTKIFPRGNATDQPYLVFLLLGMLPWQWASQVISGSARSISGEARLVRSVDVPREIWILRTVGSKFVEFLFSVPVLFVFMWVLHKGPNWYILLWPVAMGLMFVTLLGFAFILAPVCVMFSDMERLMRIVVRILFYMCPVLYGSEKVLNGKHIPEPMKQFYIYNPFTTVLSMFRGAVFRNELPGVDVALRGSCVAFALLIIGLVVFRRLEPAVLKEI